MATSPCANMQYVTPNDTLMPNLGSPLLNNIYEEGLSLFDSYGQSAFSSHRIKAVSYLLIALYSIFSILGVVGNITVLVVLLAHRSFSNITYIFVLALAVSDIVLCGFNMPLQAYYEIKETAMMSTAICRILFASFGLPMYVSCLTILLIAVDRYRIIIDPLKPRMSPTFAVMLVFVMFLFSITNSVPVAVFSQSKELSKGGHRYCVEVWPSPEARLMYSLLIFVVQFFLPLLVTALLYLRIYWRLREQRSFKKKDAERKRRTNKILVAIVTCFAVCWTPWTSYSLLLECRAYVHQTNIRAQYNKIGEENCTAPSSGGFGLIGNATQFVPFNITGKSLEMLMRSTFNSTESGLALMNSFPNEHTKLIDLLLKVFAMGSGCINPFLYGWLNDSIKDAMRRIFNSISPVKRSDYEMVPVRNSRRDRFQDNGQGGEAGAEGLEQDGFSNAYTPSMFEQSTKRSSLMPGQLVNEVGIPMGAGQFGPRLTLPKIDVILPSIPQGESTSTSDQVNILVHSDDKSESNHHIDVAEQLEHQKIDNGIKGDSQQI